MLNPFMIKKYSALLLACFFPVIAFAVGIMFYNYWIALACFFVATIIMVFIGNMLLKNPFSMMLEGKGILVFNLDSTGIIKPFIVNVISPFIKGKVDGEDIFDVYDRETVMNLATPGAAGKCVVKDNEFFFKISEDEFNKSRFGFYQYPVLIWNNQIKSLLTKDYLSEQEKQSFAEHGVLYLNRKLEELTSVVRDFGRYVVELTRPKDSIFSKPWFWWLIVMIALGILGAIFARPIFNAIMSAGGTVSDSIGSAPVVAR